MRKAIATLRWAALAVSIAAEDDYYAHFMEEVPVNE